MIISTDDDNGNKLIIPRCKVFSDRKMIIRLLVDIEYHEALKYRYLNYNPLSIFYNCIMWN